MTLFQNDIFHNNHHNGISSESEKLNFVKMTHSQNDILGINKNNTFHEGKFDKLFERM